MRADGEAMLYGDQPCPRAEDERAYPPCFAGKWELGLDRERALATTLGQAAIPPRHAKATLDNVVQPTGLLSTVIDAFTAGESLCFRGGRGTGKTWLAVALLKARLLAEPGLTGRFLVVPDFLDRIRRAYGEGQGAADEVVQAASEVDVLVLDDLGSEKDSGWALEKLYQIVNRRYEYFRQTIVTTNVDAIELRERGLESIVSRLSEMGELVQFEGEDRRSHGWREKRAT